MSSHNHKSPPPSGGGFGGGRTPGANFGRSPTTPIKLHTMDCECWTCLQTNPIAIDRMATMGRIGAALFVILFWIMATPLIMRVVAWLGSHP